MKHIFLIITTLVFLCLPAVADDLLIYDDFEGGLGMWDTAWELTTQFSISPDHSITESPVGNYYDNWTLDATTVIGADLRGYLGARVDFWAYYLIETGFDYCYVEASRDNIFWIPIGSLTGLYPFWQYVSYDLGAFAGLPEIKIRFRFVSDPLNNYDGICIDNFQVFGSLIDESGPLIIHRGAYAYAGTAENRLTYVDLWDVSGISEEHLFYRFDGRPFVEAALDSVVGERYFHTIPAQEAGTFVEYYFIAVDASPMTYNSISDTFAYLAGEMLIQDDGLSEEIFSGETGDKAALRFSDTNAEYIAAAVISIYTDAAHPVDSIDVYVWADSLGFPGAVLTGPNRVFPISTPENPEAWVWTDLRPALLQAPSDFHIGCELAVTGSSPLMGVPYDVPAVYLNSSLDNGSGFEAYDYGDFYIRAVVGSFTPDNLIAPEGLSGVGEGNLLHLSWDAPPGLDDLLRYQIERDSVIIGETDYLETEYTDDLTGLEEGLYTYRVRARYSTGSSAFCDPFEYDYIPVGIQPEPDPLQPEAFSFSVFPNPTNGMLRVDISGVSGSESTVLKLFDIMGRETAYWLMDQSSHHSFALEFPLDLAAGIYFLQAEVGKQAKKYIKIVYLP